MFAPLVLSCVGVMFSGFADSASFDHSQSGNLNVQVDLKDLQIIALLKGGKEDYVDYDYAYDYNEMTIKPQNGTTPKPLNATSSANSTGSVNDGTTAATPPTPTVPNTTDAGPETSTAPASVAQNLGNLTDLASLPMVSTTEPTANATATSGGCKKGFALNQKGDCELKLQNVGTNALLKLVKLSQKLKLRREKRTTTLQEESILL